MRREVGKWILPTEYNAPTAFFAFEVVEKDLDRQGNLQVTLRTDQKQIIHWWDERGFIAALHALWIAKIN